MDFIKIGATGTKILGPGDSAVGRVRFNIPSSAPFCTARYDVRVDVMNGETPEFYTSDSFDIDIIAK